MIFHFWHLSVICALNIVIAIAFNIFQEFQWEKRLGDTDSGTIYQSDKEQVATYVQNTIIFKLSWLYMKVIASLFSSDKLSITIHFGFMFATMLLYVLCADSSRITIVRPSRVCAVERSVHYFWDYFSFLLSFRATYFSPRRGCPRDMKFCTEF